MAWCHDSWWCHKSCNFWPSVVDPKTCTRLQPPISNCGVGFLPQGKEDCLTSNSQVSLQNSAQAVLGSISQNHPGYVTVHCIRALGNFAKHELHVNLLVSVTIIEVKLLGYHISLDTLYKYTWFPNIMKSICIPSRYFHSFGCKCQISYSRSMKIGKCKLVSLSYHGHNTIKLP